MRVSICPCPTTAASQLSVCRQWAECMVTQSDRETRVLIVPDAGSNKPIQLRVASVISLRLHYVTLYECDRCQRSRSLSVTQQVAEAQKNNSKIQFNSSTRHNWPEAAPHWSMVGQPSTEPLTKGRCDYQHELKGIRESFRAPAIANWLFSEQITKFDVFLRHSLQPLHSSALHERL